MLSLLAAMLLSALPTQLPHERVEGPRVMEFLKSLPIKRSATGDAAHLEGLRETERLIERELSAIGY